MCHYPAILYKETFRHWLLAIVQKVENSSANGKGRKPAYGAEVRNWMRFDKITLLLICLFFLYNIRSRSGTPTLMD